MAHPKTTREHEVMRPFRVHVLGSLTGLPPKGASKGPSAKHKADLEIAKGTTHRGKATRKTKGKTKRGNYRWKTSREARREEATSEKQ